jgi:hypothetical protein
VFLASNASQYVCGELLVVDGVRFFFHLIDTLIQNGTRDGWVVSQVKDQ